MASNVIVLDGNKRLPVKTTPMMPLKEIVKSVCNKQGYTDVESYGLKQNRTTLDLSLSVRFANLAPGAKLDLIRVTTPKAHSEVTVAIQMDNGERIIEKFPLTTTFWEILLHVEKNRSLNLTKRTALASAPQSKWKKMVKQSNKLFYQQPVCILLNKEYGTISSLKSTSLQSTGITSGNVLLRVMFRHTELSLDDVLEDINTSIQSQLETSLVNENDLKPVQPTIPPEANLHANPVETAESLTPVENESKSEVHPSQSQSVNEITTDVKLLDVQGSAPKSQEEQESIERSSTQTSSDTNAYESGKAHFDRDVKVFNPPSENVKLSNQMPLPDSFYELTSSELKFLLEMQSSKRKAEENAGFKTRAIRDQEEKERERKYPKTLIRVRFPDSFQIQMAFLSKETVEQLYEFVRGALRTPQRSFYLYTSPPKKVLTDMSVSLYNAGLAPASVVNFSWTDQLSDSGHFLSDEYLELRTDIPHDNLTSGIVPEVSSSIDNEDAHVLSEPSRKKNRELAQEQNSHAQSSTNKIPKWLKFGNIGNKK